MIVLLGASAIVLTALQATINAPRDAFRDCLKQATTKATSEKVASDAIEPYLKAACSGQLGSLRSALIAFDMKNGMARKAAESDASSTVNDYMSGPIDHYQFAAASNAPAKPTPATAPATAPTGASAIPASASTTPATPPPK